MDKSIVGKHRFESKSPVIERMYVNRTWVTDDGTISYYIL